MVASEFLVTKTRECDSQHSVLEVSSLKGPGVAGLGNVQVVPPGVALPAEILRAVGHLLRVAGHGAVEVEGDLLG